MNSHNFVEKIRDLIAKEIKLNTILYLSLVFKPVEKNSYIHIGSGEKDLNYIPVYKVENKPYIPLTSVYGVLRDIGEKIVKQSLNNFVNRVEKEIVEAHCELEEDTIRHICSNNQDYLRDLIEITKNIFENKLLSIHFVSEESKQEILNQLDKALKTKNFKLIPRALEPFLSFLCPICRMFGGTSVKSKIDIINIKPSFETMLIRTRTSIDRPTSTVYIGSLFSEENLSIHVLEMNLIVRNIVEKSFEAKILKTLLKYLIEIGISVGGHKSIGVGKLVLDSKESRGIYIELSKITSKEEILKSIIIPEQLNLKPIEELINNLDPDKQQ